MSERNLLGFVVEMTGDEEMFGVSGGLGAVEMRTTAEFYADWLVKNKLELPFLQ